jgi:hypothetical protein
MREALSGDGLEFDWVFGGHLGLLGQVFQLMIDN